METIYGANLSVNSALGTRLHEFSIAIHVPVLRSKSTTPYLLMPAMDDIRLSGANTTTALSTLTLFFIVHISDAPAPHCHWLPQCPSAPSCPQRVGSNSIPVAKKGKCCWLFMENFLFLVHQKYLGCKDTFSGSSILKGISSIRLPNQNKSEHS